MAGFVARVGADTITTGHDCDAVAGIAGLLQTTVKIAGSYVAVQGDAIAPHTIDKPKGCILHPAGINVGAPRVHINTIPMARIADSADMGAVATGHPKVYCGD